MRLSKGIAVLLVLSPLGGIPCVLGQEASDTKKAITTDAERIQGHWEGTETIGGIASAAARHLVFTANQVKIPNFLCAYRLHQNTKPKQIDLFLTGPGNNFVMSVPFKGIYEFEGDRLRICYALSDRDERPTKFTSNKGEYSTMLILKRGSRDSQLPPRLVRLGCKRATTDIAKELTERVAAILQQIEAGKFQLLQEELLPAKKPSTSAQSQPINTAFISFARSFAPLLQATKNRTPWLSADGAEAFFDVRDIHFDDAPPFFFVRFSKIDGKWCLREDREQ